MSAQVLVYSYIDATLGFSAVADLCAEIAENWIHPVTRSHLRELLSKQETSVSDEFVAHGKTWGQEAS
jgi:hypothetical protein